MDVHPGIHQLFLKPLRDQELKTFRKQLYDSQCKDGRLIPSKAAPTPSETQARCRHPFDSLRWSANQDGHYAKCKDCDLKSCLYWTVKHGALMVTLAHDRPPGIPWQAKVWVEEKEDATQLQTVREGGPKPSQICSRMSKTSTGEVLLQDDYTGEDVPFHKDITHQAVLITEFWYIEPHQAEVYNAVKKKLPPHLQTPGLAIADSGCRNAVGGRLWHEALQGALTKIKVPWTQVEEHEVYRFGAGAPVISTKAFIYPVLIHGAWDVVRISLVEGEATSCPGLIGPAELSRWKAVFRFSEKELELNGTSRPMILTWTRHPGIRLLDYEDTEADEARSFWESTEGRRRRKVLQENPQSLSFVAGAGEGSEGEEGSTEDEEPPVDTTDAEEEDQPFRGARKEQWLQQLQEDLGVKVIEAMSEDEEPEEAEESSSSHEVGVEVISSDSEEEEDKREVAAQREEEVQEQQKGKKKNMNKQLRRKLGHHVHEIAMSYNQEQEKPTSSAISETFVQRRVRPTRSRWSVLEVFTWTCAISLVAAARHWHFHEPVTLPRWDFMKSNDYAEALDYIDRVDPDLLVLAWPCGPWSPLQSLGNKTPLQRAQLQVKREENRTLLRFVRDATLAQRKRGGAVLGENPKPSLAWKEPLIEEAFAGTGDSICDMCTFGLRLPQGPFLKKRTRLRGTEEIVARCNTLCPGHREHTPVVGGAKINGQWMPVSAFAGGYTTKFAREVILGAEQYLRKKRPQEVFAEGGELSEEQLMEEEEKEEQELEEEANGQEGEEKKGSEGWRVAMIHQRLGHPTTATLVRMLTLAGASKDTIKIAENYKCPICQKVAPPDRYLKVNPFTRTSIFGKEVHIDLKYMHDANGKLHVALSMIDGGTSFHAACILLNRKAEYVAKKFHRHWASIYGTPTTLFVDQERKFDGAFIGWLETHGIHFRATGARAGWQHGFAERHGGLLGHAWHAIIWQYKAKGKSEMKAALAAAIQAKNQTITRGGFTPYQMVFGRAPMFPDLLEEDSTGNLALRESLTTEGEVQRSLEMRAAAKISLLRKDCQDKLKRALRRWPRGKIKEFTPGEMIYFYSPQPTAKRFKRDAGAWRGPAVILMKESSERYYISWRGRCLLVAASNLRCCTELEGGDFQGRMQELEHLEKKWEDEKDFEDMTQVPQPPEEGEKEEEVGWQPQEEVIVQKRGGWKKARAKEIAKSLKGLRKVQKTIKKDKERQPRLKLKDDPKSKEEITIEIISEKKKPEEATEEKKKMQEIDRELAKEIVKQLGELDSEGYKKRLREVLQDDVPMSLKHRRTQDTGQHTGLTEEELAQRFTPEFMHYTMLSLVHDTKRANEWATRSEVKKMKELLDLPITGMRYHIKPRKRFQKPPKPKRSRITIMFGETTGTAMVCQENQEEVKTRPKRKAPRAEGRKEGGSSSGRAAKWRV